MAIYDAVIRKKVGEKFRLPPFDVIEDLASGETIASCTAAATPAGLTLTGLVQISGTQIHQIVEGGVAGTDYVIRFTMTTSAGQVFIYDCLVKVVA